MPQRGENNAVSSFATAKRIVMCNRNCARLSPQSDGRSSPCRNNRNRHLFRNHSRQISHTREIIDQRTLQITRIVPKWSILADRFCKVGRGLRTSVFQRRARARYSKLKAGDTNTMSEQMGGGEIAELVQQMEQSEDDPRRCYALVKQRISEYRQMGSKIPEDLERMERALMVECMLESQGR